MTKGFPLEKIFRGLSPKDYCASQEGRELKDYEFVGVHFEGKRVASLVGGARGADREAGDKTGKLVFMFSKGVPDDAEVVVEYDPVVTISYVPPSGPEDCGKLVELCVATGIAMVPKSKEV